MGKFEEATKNIYNVFGSSAWKTLGINTQPENFKGVSGETVVLSTVFSNTIVDGTTLQSVAGLLMIDIYVDTNKGPTRAHQIAGNLDDFLVAKSLKTTSGSVTQLLRSNLTSVGVDPANSSLYRYSYSIPFNHFGAN